MSLPCLPNKKKQQHRQSFVGDELHAFDLTWRNYIPSASQFCCCFKSRGIQLEDDDPLIDPPYYNDQTLYRGEALQNYLDNPRDWEFESVLGGQNDLPQFVTRNPFGTSSLKKKKSHKKKKNRRERSAVMETDAEEGDVAGYSIADQHQHEEYYNDDAEFLGDDQIANLAYNRHSSQVMDQYGEELYQGYVQGPIEQEMQAPPPPREFYAARAIPNIDFDSYEDYEERAVPVQHLQPSSSSSSSSAQQQNPLVSVEAAQALLSDKLDDLTEKLAFIKNNIIHIRPQSSQQEADNTQDTDEEYDRTTLHTLHHEEPRESHSISDLDSVASEALDVYENTASHSSMHNPSTTHSSIARRYSSGDELHIPSLVDNTPFVSEQHPFSYFTDHNNSTPSHHQEDASTDDESSNVNNNDGINVQSVFNMGRKWLGV
ncbi:hypothetical protein MBANPS3_006983 [Mucor bainieri]